MTVKIEQWAVVTSNDPYLAPECRVARLGGVLVGHPRVPDNSPPATTSRIVGRIGDNIVTRSGTVYELGEPAPDYIQQFPDAKQRLLDSLKELL